MKYLELTLHTTTEASEIVADIMWNYTDFGVTICDKNDIDSDIVNFVYEVIIEQIPPIKAFNTLWERIE